MHENRPVIHLRKALQKCRLLLKQYKYSIACENVDEKNYITEKVYDCFLSLTFPLYWGAENLHDYYPQNSFEYINIENISKGIEQVKTIIAKDLNQNQIQSLEKAKNLTLDQYGLWPQIENAIKTSKSADK